MTVCVMPVPAGAAAPLAMLHCACFPDDPWGEPAIGQILGLLGGFGFVAWSEGEPVGFLLARCLGDEGEILSLGVIPQARRSGAGRLLLAAAIAAAEQRGLASLVLEVAADNLPARALYAQSGFVRLGLRVRYYRRIEAGPADALVLRRALAAR